MARRFLLPLVAPVAIRMVPRPAGGSRLFEYIGQLRIHYWMSEQEKRRAPGRRSRVVGRRLPWTGQNFYSLSRNEWQAHVYGEINVERLTVLRAELNMQVRVFPACRRAGPIPGTVYLIPPDGLWVAAALPDAAPTRSKQLCGNTSEQRRRS